MEVNSTPLFTEDFTSQLIRTSKESKRATLLFAVSVICMQYDSRYGDNVYDVSYNLQPLP